MQRHGELIGLRPEATARYIELHTDIWTAVKEIDRDCGITNDSIFLIGDQLFRYFEYIGENYEADMARLAHYPVMRKWWDLCKPCQQPIDGARSDQWWLPLREISHVD